MVRLEDTWKARRNSPWLRGKAESEATKEIVFLCFQILRCFGFAWEPCKELERAFKPESSAFPCSSLLPGAVLEFAILFYILPLLPRNSNWMFEVAVFPEHGESLSCFVCR